MTVLVEKFIEMPFEYSSDEEALEYIEVLMQLGDWQAVCDVIQRDSRGAVVDCPEGVSELYFDDDMQVVLFTVAREVTEEWDPELEPEDGWEPAIVEVRQVRAVSFVPERDENA